MAGYRIVISEKDYLYASMPADGAGSLLTSTAKPPWSACNGILSCIQKGITMIHNDMHDAGLVESDALCRFAAWVLLYVVLPFLLVSAVNLILEMKSTSVADEVYRLGKPYRDKKLNKPQ
jgi:hypothetical protein